MRHRNPEFAGGSAAPVHPAPTVGVRDTSGAGSG